MSIFLFTYHPAFISTKIKVKAKIICKKVSVHNSHAKLDIIVDNATMILFFLKIHAKFSFICHLKLIMLIRRTFAIAQSFTLRLIK